MNATPVNQTQKELVRLLVMEHGLQKASELSGVSYDLVRQWESRRQRKEKRIVTNVTNPVQQVADRLQDELADNEKETRLSLSRYARRAAKDAEQATLKDAPYVHKAAQIGEIAFKWSTTDKPTHFTLNMLNLSMFDQEGNGEQEAKADTIDT